MNVIIIIITIFIFIIIIIFRALLAHAPQFQMVRWVITQSWTGEEVDPGGPYGIVYDCPSRKRAELIARYWRRRWPSRWVAVHQLQ